MKKIIRKLKKAYPDSRCSLHFKSPFQLLVSTVLSAQCTDARVNQVTPGLFAKFPTAEAMNRAKSAQIEKLIHSTGFYKNKTKALKSLSRDLIEKFDGEFPSTLDQLISLRGVGRKTANVVLGTAFGVPGMVVDTHVMRISRRMGFTQKKDAVKIEFGLMEIVPKKDWVAYTHLIIDHGRAVCTARRAGCEGCVLSVLCPKLE